MRKFDNIADYLPDRKKNFGDIDSKANVGGSASSSSGGGFGGPQRTGANDIEVNPNGSLIKTNMSY